MSDVRAGWPGTAWKLTAAESAVLLNGPALPGAETFKLALMELVTRGCLRLAEVAQPRRLLGARRVTVLVEGGRPRAPAERVLAGLWDLYRSLPGQSFGEGVYGVRLDQFLKAARGRQGGPGRFTESEVLPSLVELGLMEHQRRRLLGIFPRGRHELTPAGQRARAELQQWLDVGREQLGAWTRDDPSRAVAFTAMAGAVLLLMPSVFPDLQLLSQQLQPTPPAAAGDGAAADAGLASDEELPAFDLPTMDLGGLSFDFGVFDSFESAFDALDSAVDAGGGDGGDGGGGGSD